MELFFLIGSTLLLGVSLWSMRRGDLEATGNRMAAFSGAVVAGLLFLYWGLYAAGRLTAWTETQRLLAAIPLANLSATAALQAVRGFRMGSRPAVASGPDARQSGDRQT